MADDIDIEEHDVLDNPAIKNMFPDISVLKQEMKNFEAEVQDPVNDKISNSENVMSAREVIDHEIKPNKRSSVTVDVDVEIIELDDDLETKPTEIELSENFNANKIILGSKPNKSLEYEEDFFEKQVKSYDVDIVLDDLKPYLDTSGRFCNKCLILFPNEIAMDIHNKTYHAAAIQKKKYENVKIGSFNCKKFKCPKCNNVYSSQASLCRHNKKVHRGKVRLRQMKKMLLNGNYNIKNQDQSTQNKKECFHCKKLFPTQQSLIEHLYSTLQSKKYMCKVCSKYFAGIEQLNQHMLTHKTFVVIKENEQSDLISKIKKTFNNNPEEVQTKIKTRRTAETVKSVDLLTLEPKRPNTTEALETQSYYRCYICSYYFRHSKALSAHLASKHNVTEDCEEMQKEKFDSLCKYCSKAYYNINSFNSHLSALHKEHVNNGIREQEKISNWKSLQCDYTASIHSKLKQNTENKGNTADTEPLALTSAFFKCSKCDIHFISPKVARNHTEHIEMLINWKCSKCKHIFKKEDESLHEEQHKYCQEFTVHDLCPVTASPVLFSCPRCKVHFDEDNFPKHKLICENEAPNSVYCIICDISIDNSLSKTHRAEHLSKNFKPSDFVIVQSDILTNFNRIVRHNKSRVKENSNIQEKKNSESLKRKCNEKMVAQHKIVKQSNDLLNFTYCRTCKCFLSDTDERELHIEDRCYNLEKCICKICGLVLTAQSYTTTHRNIHSLLKNVQLKDFRFYDLENSESIYPPIPEYLKCENCDVYHISKDSIFSHDCSENEYLTCHVCNINLTEDAFKLHILFHNCSKTNSSRISNNFTGEMRAAAKEKVIKKKQQIGTKGPNKEYHSVESKSTRLSVRKETDKRNSTKMVSQKSKTSNKSGKNSVQIMNNSRNKSKLNNIPKSVQSFSNHKDLKIVEKRNSITAINSAKTITLDEVIYQCKNCCVSVDTYDKVIEHCFTHYSNEEDDIETVKCPICEKLFDKSCFENHRKLNMCNKDYFTFLYFDIFYFTSENRIWVEHVFGTLTPEQKNKIISESIYKYECRIKMEVIQKGPADLTVYKCDQCRTFIDGTGLYKHAENSCFAIRKLPCSVCGIPFNSSVSRIEHEKLHEASSINSKNFRIVTFNKEGDKDLNAMLKSRSDHYILYQCRNCSIAVDKSQSKKHKCHEQYLKLCSACGLLLSNDYYDVHILRHKELTNFIQKHMKIVLFGETKENIKDVPSDKVPTFSGIVYDYTFYSCSKCQVCVKSNENLDRHTCSFGTNRLKCSNCKLYFMTSKLKHHIKLHKTYPDFIRENIRLILFNPQNAVKDGIDLNTEGEEAILSESNDSKNNRNDLQSHLVVTTIDSKEKDDVKVEEKCTKIYKCTCGLHFLDHFSFAFHYRICNPKIRATKLNCTKCDLLFTADILFTHMLLHHGNKSQIYKFTVIDVIKDNNVVYRCLNCNLHFTKVNDINDHFSTCDETIEGKICIFCNLKFEPRTFKSHTCNNVENVNAGVEVVDLHEPLVSRTSAAENKQERKIIYQMAVDDCNNVDEANGNVDVNESFIGKATVTAVDGNKYSENMLSENNGQMVSNDCINVHNANAEVVDFYEDVIHKGAASSSNQQSEISHKQLDQTETLANVANVNRSAEVVNVPLTLNGTAEDLERNLLNLSVPDSVHVKQQKERHNMDLEIPNHTGILICGKVSSSAPEVRRIETLGSSSERVSTSNTSNTHVERALKGTAEDLERNLLNLSVPNSIHVKQQEERHNMDLEIPNHTGIPICSKVSNSAPEVRRIETLSSSSERVSTSNTSNTHVERAGAPHQRHWKFKKKWNNFVHPHQNMPRMPPRWQNNTYHWGNENSWEQEGPSCPRAAPYQHTYGRPYL